MAAVNSWSWNKDSTHNWKKLLKKDLVKIFHLLFICCIQMTIIVQILLKGKFTKTTLFPPSKWLVKVAFAYFTNLGSGVNNDWVFNPQLFLLYNSMRWLSFLVKSSAWVLSLIFSVHTVICNEGGETHKEEVRKIR